MKPHYLGHRKRLRKRFLDNGIEALSDYEILELLLSFSIPVKDTKTIAKTLLKKYGSIKEVFSNLYIKDFLQITGVGEQSFVLFKLVNDINKYIATEKFLKKKIIKSILDVVEFSKNIMWNLSVEEFRIIFLNSKNEILNCEKVAEGIVNEAYIYVRKIFEKAFYYHATALILIHNHPSGKAVPSKEDIAITQKIVTLARDLGITIHDHVIIARDGFYSFNEHNRI